MDDGAWVAKVKPIFWLSIWSGFFKIGFYFGGEVREELLKLPISAAAKELIANAKPMGKTARFMPVVFDVKDAAQLNDVFAIAEYRKEKVK